MTHSKPLLPEQAPMAHRQRPSSNSDISPVTRAETRIFVEEIRASLLARSPSWAVTLHPAPHVIDVADSTKEGLPADDDPSGAQDPVGPEGSCAQEDWSVIDLLDQLAKATHPSAPLPDGSETPGPIARLRPGASMAVLTLATTFGSIEHMVRKLGASGSVTLLVCGNSEVEESFLALIEHLIGPQGIWPRAIREPLVVTPETAIAKKDARHGTPGHLAADLRKALEIRQPIVLVAPAAGMLPKHIQAINPEIVTLAPFDRRMLAAVLNDAYPGQVVREDALAGIPENAVISRLAPDDLLLALRWPDLSQAVVELTRATRPDQHSGPALAEFPLTDSVRRPLDGMLDDLRAWRAGEIAWHDVTRGILLAGPPGTGKTELARLVAREAGISVIACSVAGWQSTGERSGDLVRAMRKDFAKAASMAPCILFIDEIDACGDRARQDHNISWVEFVVSALLECLDGFTEMEGVVPMAATNHVGRIDAALKRPGRFDKILYLDNPAPDQMPKAFRWQLGGDLADADLTGVAAQAVGMSGAEIAGLVRAARARARVRKRPLMLEDLTVILDETRPPMPEIVRWQIAVHEAGHAVVGAATGLARPNLLAIQPTGGITSQGLRLENQRRAEVEAMMAIAMGGRAAEVCFFGLPSGGAGGPPESDLGRATGLAVALETCLGLGESLVWLGSTDMMVGQLRLDARLRGRIEAHLRAAEARALRIVEKNRELLHAIADALCGTGMLTGPELEALISKVAAEDTCSARRPTT